MATIEVTDKQKELFTEIADDLHMTVGDFLLKCVKTVCYILKEWEDGTK